jgi:hypothetical protein
MPVFDGAPWPPEAAQAAAELSHAPDATLAVGADALPSGRDRDGPTRWPIGGQQSRAQATALPAARSATAATAPPPARGGSGKWIIIGALATMVLAGAGFAAMQLIPAGTATTPEASETPTQAAERKIQALLGEARAAIAKRDFAAAERALGEAESLATQHNLAAPKQEIAQVRAELARARSTVVTPTESPGGIPAGSWPSDAELRRAVEETMQKLAR